MIAGTDMIHPFNLLTACDAIRKKWKLFVSRNLNFTFLFKYMYYPLSAFADLLF